MVNPWAPWSRRPGSMTSCPPDHRGAAIRARWASVRKDGFTATIPLAAPRTDPDGRSLAHPVLISDNWRRSERQERDGALAVEGAIAERKRECASRGFGVSGSCGE